MKSNHCLVIFLVFVFFVACKVAWILSFRGKERCSGFNHCGKVLLMWLRNVRWHLWPFRWFGKESCLFPVDKPLLICLLWIFVNQCCVFFHLYGNFAHKQLKNGTHLFFPEESFLGNYFFEDLWGSKQVLRLEIT